MSRTLLISLFWNNHVINTCGKSEKQLTGWNQNSSRLPVDLCAEYPNKSVRTKLWLRKSSAKTYCTGHTAVHRLAIQEAYLSLTHSVNFLNCLSWNMTSLASYADANSAEKAMVQPTRKNVIFSCFKPLDHLNLSLWTYSGR